MGHGAVLRMITYFVHGVLNNYLDTDKAARHWGFWPCSSW